MTNKWLQAPLKCPFVPWQVTEADIRRAVGAEFWNKLADIPSRTEQLRASQLHSSRTLAAHPRW